MIDKVKLMPDLPAPYAMRDWKQVAVQYDRLVFDFEARGNFFPLIWWDRAQRNVPRDTFGLPSYLGDKRREESHEAINTVMAVLGATLCGIDKSAQGGHDWVAMLEAYYNTANGQMLFLNRTHNEAGRTFWYEIYPHVLLYALASCYPGHGALDSMMEHTADRWLLACEALRDASGIPDFNHLAFSFETMQPVDNGRWREPEAAAGVAWLQYMAYARWGGAARLQAAQDCLAFLEQREASPFYEILLPYGAYIAARMNAELGTAHDVAKLANAVFSGDSDCRPGWGVVAERWGDYDCHGLCGSLTDWGQRWDVDGSGPWDTLDPERGGYAFAANTFSLAAGLVPLVRYDARFAPDIAKWLLNAANAARLFYPGALPAKQQSCAFYEPDPHDVIAYEGLRKWWDYHSPYATGDPIRYSWGAIDLGLYGSSHVGFFGGIISLTDVEGILRLDCLRTDFFHAAAYPTYLLYNPHADSRAVSLEGWADAVPVATAKTNGSEADLTASGSGVAIYDAYSHQMLVYTGGRLELPGKATVLAVLLPEDGVLEEQSHGQSRRRLWNGVVIDYDIGAGS